MPGASYIVVEHVLGKRAELVVDRRHGLGHGLQPRVGMDEDGTDRHGRDIGEAAAPLQRQPARPAAPR